MKIENIKIDISDGLLNKCLDMSNLCFVIEYWNDVHPLLTFDIEYENGQTCLVIGFKKIIKK